MKEICVVHLVHAQNGTEPLLKFLKSYRQYPGGFDHDLLIIFKGFSKSQDISDYETLLAEFPYSALKVSDDGFDFAAYFAAIKHYSEQYRYFCFLNSYSVIQDESWLEKLHRQIIRPNVGMVGATGSWESHRKSVPAWKLPYYIARRIYDHDQNTTTNQRFTLKRSTKALFQGVRQLPFFLSFDRFPNYHLRTNAFMISSEIMKGINCPPMYSKNDAYKMESGKKGLTRQVLASGKRILVVGKDGVGYEKENWNKSRTFWQFNQENLLVSDNQTSDFFSGDTKMRCYLSLKAWGARHIDKE